MKPEIRSILLAAVIPLFFVFILYAIKVMEVGMDWDFTTLGVYPLEKRGVFGIFAHPLVHADWGHLIANTFPLLFLSWCLFYFYKDFGAFIFFFVWIVCGTLTFIIGKPGWHVGASGLIYALAFFLFFSGIIRKHVPLLAISFLVIFLYGGLVWNMTPLFAHPTTSWEGHLSGAVAGTIAAFLFQNKGSQKPDPFEHEEEEEKEGEAKDEITPID
ncbi:MAG: rhomboid family intramembrane serine protease [Bacteroidaceae bacterium]